MCLRDTHRRTEIGRFDEHGQAELGDGAFDERSGLTGTGAELDPAALRNPGLGGDDLGHRLVHAQRRREHPTAHVGHIGQLQHSLDSAVLAVRAVQQRQHDRRPIALTGDLRQRLHLGARGFEGVGQCGCRLGECGDRLVVADPRPAGGDAHRDQLVLGPIRCRKHVSCGNARHIVLGGRATEEDQEPQTAIMCGF